MGSPPFERGASQVNFNAVGAGVPLGAGVGFHAGTKFLGGLGQPLRIATPLQVEEDDAIDTAGTL